MKSAKRGTVAAAVLASAVIVTGGAAASKPKPYQGVAGATQGAVQNASAASPTSTPTGSLPFTGADLGLFGAGGLALVVAGYTLNRRGKRNLAE
ncbi:MAG TPA: hypothetical protein VG265_03145 [Gaiellaceae bacterium]|jgi:hypothetical protein|nr:hypothetical protein [Gaiellaceae bacterium]